MPQFSTEQYAWKDLSVAYLGRSLVGFQEVKFKESSDDDFVYGRGRDPLAIQSGNKKVEGNIIFLQSEIEALFDAVKALPGSPSIIDISADLVITFGVGNTAKTKIVYGVKFGEYEYGMAQEDKYMKVSIPFKALGVKAG